MFRIILSGAFIISVAVAVLLIGALVYRAYCQHQNSRALRIDTSVGIDEEMFVSIGGIDQWIQIRGESRDNPVILVLHGGPGFSYIPFTANFRSWERQFTVVQWDQ